jgi:hypothetical protein
MSRRWLAAGAAAVLAAAALVAVGAWHFLLRDDVEPASVADARVLRVALASGTRSAHVSLRSSRSSSRSSEAPVYPITWTPAEAV